MGLIVGGLVVLCGLIVVGLAYHNTLGEGWQAIAGTAPQAQKATT